MKTKLIITLLAANLVAISGCSSKVASNQGSTNATGTPNITSASTPQVQKNTPQTSSGNKEVQNLYLGNMNMIKEPDKLNPLPQTYNEIIKIGKFGQPISQKSFDDKLENGVKEMSYYVSIDADNTSKFFDHIINVYMLNDKVLNVEYTEKFKTEDSDVKIKSNKENRDTYIKFFFKDDSKAAIDFVEKVISDYPTNRREQPGAEFKGNYGYGKRQLIGDYSIACNRYEKPRTEENELNTNVSIQISKVQ